MEDMKYVEGNIQIPESLEKSLWGLEQGVSHSDIIQVFNPLPEMLEILLKAESLEDAREKLKAFLSELMVKCKNGELTQNPIDRWLCEEAINVFQNLISEYMERIAGFSTLEYLWKAVKGDENTLNILTYGFVEEFRHLVLAISGKAEYSKGWLGGMLLEKGIEFVDFDRIKGRKAGQMRSKHLDATWELVKGYIERYPTGLDREVIEKRKIQKEKLMEYWGIDESKWNSFRWQFAHVLKREKGLETLKELNDLGIVKVPEKNLKLVELAIRNHIPWGVTPYYLHLWDFDEPYRYDTHVRRQVMPPPWYIENMLSHTEDREFYFDFMGEHDTSPVELVTRRYTMVAIVKPYETCPQICVYCQRNWEVTEPFMANAFPGWEKIEKALEWFGERESMIDVLITGGDPLVLSDKTLERILDRVSEFDHVANIRIGTRILVTVPMRITENLAELLGHYIEPGRRNLCISTHFETAYEVTPEVCESAYRLRKQGIVIYNQHVYHRMVSRRFENVVLRIALKKAGIEPYYTFFPKGKIEQKDYLIPIARIVQERKEEARLLPGVFRGDEPVFNVPRLGKNHLRAWQDRELIAIKPDGSRVYLMHPWDKGINETKLYTYSDVPIKEYLDYLESIGENPEDYRTIWYYY